MSTRLRSNRNRDRRSLVLAIVIAFLVGPATVSATEPEPAALVARALVREAGDLVRPATDDASDEAATRGILARLTLAQILLSEAAALDPDNVEIQRRLALVTRATGDAETHEAAARRILSLEPRDGLVQLDRVSSGLARVQTVESRLKIMNRFLRAKAAGLDPGVRSRIIFEAALLADESGDTDGAIERLVAAQRLDPTNIDAAALLALWADSAGGSTRDVVSAMLRLVRADPFQVAGLTDLAGVLLELGSYEQSQRASEIAISLVQARRQPIPSQLATQRLLAMAGAQSIADAVAGVSELLPRDDYPRGQRGYQNFMTTHHVLAAQVQSSDHANRAWNGLSASWRARLDRDSVDTDAVRFERAWLSTLSGHDYPERDDDVAALRAQAADWALTDPRLLAWRRVEGWLAIRDDALDAAIAILEPMADSDPWSDLGLARSLRSAGRVEAATRRLTAIHQRVPGTLVGILAKAELEAILQRTLPSLGLNDDYIPMVARDLGVIESLIARPSTGLTMRIVPVETEVAPLDPLRITLEFRNSSRWALPIREDSLLSPNVIIVPQLIVAGRPIPVPGGGIVLNIQRRFFLSPGQTLRVSVDLSETVLGSTFDAHPWLRGSLRYRVFMGFLIGSDGRLYPGPLALTHESESVRRDPWPFTEAFVNDTMSTLDRAGDSKDWFAAIAVLGALERLRVEPSQHALLPVLPWMIDAIDAAATRLSQSWPMQTPLQHAWILLQIPAHTDASEGTLGEIGRLAMQSDDRLTQITYLVTRVTSSSDPLLVDAIASEDDVVQRTAAAMRDLLVARGQ